MEPHDLRPSRVALLAVGIGLFFTAQFVVQAMAVGRPVSVGRDIVQEQLYWFTWAAFAPLIVAIVRRWPVDTVPMRATVGRHLLVTATLVPLQALIAFSLDYAFLRARGGVDGLSLPVWLEQRRVVLVWGVFMGTFFYWVIVAVYSIAYYRRLYVTGQLDAAESAGREALLKTELTRAQLDALRGQLRPHFLFNTLNAISVLSTEDAGRARQMLLRLGSLLRRSLEEEQHEVPLQQELAYLREYLEIQRERFGDRLAITEQIAADLDTVPVPVFLLQPLVENAIVHGAAERDGVTRIEVRADRQGDRLRITVRDHGPGVGHGAGSHDGIGLRNTRERLAQLYGDAGTLTLANAAEPGMPAGAVAVVTLPIQAPVPCGS